MTYTPTTWVTGTTALSAAVGNNFESQYSEAIQSLEQHLFTAFVLAGGVCSIHGGAPKQLDFTAIDAFPLQATDSTLRWRHVAAGNFTSSTPSTTYFLDLNPDGSMSWATTHSGVANYLPICSVTTDASQNLVTITDARTLNTTLLTAMLGAIVAKLMAINSDAGQFVTNGSGQLSAAGSLNFGNGGPISATQGNIHYDASAHAVVITPPQSGATALGDTFQSWTGSTFDNTLSIGAQYGGAHAWFDSGTGNLHTSVVQSTTTYIGFKDSAGNKIAEMKNGSFTIPGNGTYFTAGANYNTSTTGAFDAFDLAEVYRTDKEYRGGEVVCPQGGLMRSCTHDGCHAASVVSKVPGFAIGAPADLAGIGETGELLALVGRVLVSASSAIAERDLVASDGMGGVRAMRPGEAGFSLGVALYDSDENFVGVILRPMYCVAPGLS